MGHDQRIVVHIDDTALRCSRLRDLVGVISGGKPSANVKELADSHLIDQIPHRARQKPPDGTGEIDDLGHDRLDLVPTCSSTG